MDNSLAGHSRNPWAVPRQSLGGGCQKSISPQGSGLQKWILCPDTLSLDLDPLLHSGVVCCAVVTKQGRFCTRAAANPGSMSAGLSLFCWLIFH